MKRNNISLFHVLVIFVLTAANAFSFPLWVSLAVDVTAAIFLGGSVISMGSKKERSIIYRLIVLCAYTFIVCLCNFEFSSYTLGKPLRLIVFYALFIYLTGTLAKYKTQEIAFGVLLALLLHTTCVYLQFFIPSTKEIFFTFLRFDDKIEIIEDPLRAFGLDASFDGAGLDICILIVLIWRMFLRSRRIVFFLLGGFSLLSCFMVGRTAMLVGSVVFAMMMFSLMKKHKRYFMFACVIMLFGVYYVWDLFQFYMDNYDVINSYRPETVTALTSKRMVFLPDTFLGCIFGTGLTAASSDIGYIKIIHMIGFLGLFFVLYLYLATIKLIKTFKKIDKDVYMFMFFFLLLLLAYNYKLLLLYSRGINDIYFLLIFIILRKQSTINANNQISRL